MSHLKFTNTTCSVWQVQGPVRPVPLPEVRDYIPLHSPSGPVRFALIDAVSCRAAERRPVRATRAVRVERSAPRRAQRRSSPLSARVQASRSERNVEALNESYNWYSTLNSQHCHKYWLVEEHNKCVKNRTNRELVARIAFNI